MTVRPVQKDVTGSDVNQPFLADLTSMSDLSPAMAEGLLELATLVKARPADFRSALSGKQIVLFFEKPSFRTRLTFESGIYSLGGHAMFVDQLTSRIGEREPISDMAHNLERWVDALVLRTFAHSTVTELARFASIPVINALSDYEHPCQALADFLTLREKVGDLRKTRLAFVGDGNNVAHSLILGAALFGSHIVVGTPKRFEPHADVLAAARAIAIETGATVQVVNDPIEAVKGANAVYTDVWASMGQEKEVAERARIFASFRVTPKLFARRARGRVHALSSGASRRRSGCSRNRFACFRCIRSGGEPPAHSEGDPSAIIGRRRSALPIEEF